ncbi:MAG: hypothetical protein V3T14_00425 [Myxococcota bacterium]
MTAAAGLMDVTFQDWEGTRKAELVGVARDTTIGELAYEAVRSLGLPPRGFYQTLRRGKSLSPGETVEEAGIEPGDDLELFPEVSAGG